MTSWRPTKLGDVLTPVSRPEKLDPTTEYRLLGVRLDGAGPFHRETKLGSQTSAGTLSRVEAGDFIYSRLFAWRGAFGIISEDLDGGYVSGEFPTFAAVPGKVDLKFLNYWFRIPATLEAVEADCTGSTPLTRNRFKEEFFLALEIPLPPLSEQRRIVARIEQLAAQIEEARRLRHQATEQSEALTGSAAAKLLDNSDGWPRTTIEAVCDVRGGIQKCSARAPGANPRRYITVAHVQRNRIDTGDPRFFEVSDEELQRWRLLDGDVLVVEGNGSSEQVGRTALFRGEIEDCVHQNHVIRVRPDQKQILPEFLNTYLNSPIGRGQMLERSRTTSGLYNLSVGRINAIEFPLPPMAEQRRLVGYLDGLAGPVARLARLQTETAAALDALLPSILDKAFQGDL